MRLGASASQVGNGADMSKLVGILAALQEQLSDSAKQAATTPNVNGTPTGTEPHEPAAALIEPPTALALRSQEPEHSAALPDTSACEKALPAIQDEQQGGEAEAAEIARLQKMARKKAKMEALDMGKQEGERPIATPARNHDEVLEKLRLLKLDANTKAAEAAKPKPILKMPSPSPVSTASPPSEAPTSVATASLSGASETSDPPPALRPTVSIEIPVNSTTHKKEYMRLDPQITRLVYG